MGPYKARVQKYGVAARNSLVHLSIVPSVNTARISVYTEAALVKLCGGYSKISDSSCATSSKTVSMTPRLHFRVFFLLRGEGLGAPDTSSSLRSRVAAKVDP